MGVESFEIKEFPSNPVAQVAAGKALLDTLWGGSPDKYLAGLALYNLLGFGAGTFLTAPKAIFEAAPAEAVPSEVTEEDAKSFVQAVASGAKQIGPANILLFIQIAAKIAQLIAALADKQS